MKTIYKYPVEMTDDFEIDMPIGAKVLSVQVQNGKPYIWALVNPESASVKHSFHLAGTGHPIPDENFACFIGTFQLQGELLVFHLFGK